MNYSFHGISSPPGVTFVLGGTIVNVSSRLRFSPVGNRDVSHMPHGKRRALYQGVIEEIRLFNKHFSAVPALPDDGDPAKFYQATINDPRSLPYSEGVVVEYKDAVDGWFKLKANDTLDVKVVRCIEGTRKFAGNLGAMVVEGPTGVESENQLILANESTAAMDLGPS